MKTPITVMALVIFSCVMTLSQASSEEPRHLRGHQFAIYHACLYDSWIHDWCHTHDVAYQQCVISYGGGRYTEEGRLFQESYCYRVAKGLRPASGWSKD
jgi:hypothetical protein